MAAYVQKRVGYFSRPNVTSVISPSVLVSVGMRPMMSVMASVMSVVHFKERRQSTRGFSSAIIVAAAIMSVSI